MDRYAMMSQEERSVIMREKLSTSTRGSIHVSTNLIIDAGVCLSIPHVPDTAGVAPRVESPRYTGTLVRGIGTMHKSNAVPIINEEEMKDIARMRR